jgi:hypothetical protein
MGLFGRLFGIYDFATIQRLSHRVDNITEVQAQEIHLMQTHETQITELDNMGMVNMSLTLIEEAVHREGARTRQKGWLELIMNQLEVLQAQLFLMRLDYLSLHAECLPRWIATDAIVSVFCAVKDHAKRLGAGY